MTPRESDTCSISGKTGPGARYEYCYGITKITSFYEGGGSELSPFARGYATHSVTTQHEFHGRNEVFVSDAEAANILLRLDCDGRFRSTSAKAFDATICFVVAVVFGGVAFGAYAGSDGITFFGLMAACTAIVLLVRCALVLRRNDTIENAVARWPIVIGLEAGKLLKPEMSVWTLDEAQLIFRTKRLPITSNAQRTEAIDSPPLADDFG
jgi:hypothetical protein